VRLAEGKRGAAMTDDENQNRDGTLTRTGLRAAAYRACPSLSREEVREIVDATLDEISKALLRGEIVKLNAFGTFKVRSKPERIGRNPKTRVEAIITPRRVVTFKPSRMLVAHVSGHEPNAKAAGPGFADDQ
jgi:integration host factor subunit alpha